MEHQITLCWGLPVPGTDRIVKHASLRPLTIGGELAAMALLDERWGDSNPEGVEAAITETLAYWVQQLKISGIVLTVDYLIEHLTGEDYRIILSAQEDLRAKYTAATEQLEGSVAAVTHALDTTSVTDTTAKL